MMERFVHPSGEDERDYRIPQFVPGRDIIPDKAFCLDLPRLNVILDQGNIGACVAYSVGTCKSILEYQGTNKWIKFSAMMLYGHRRPNHWQGRGMWPREALSNLRHDGMWLKRDFNTRREVPELFPFVSRARAENPNLNRDALKFRVCGYARLRNDNEIKKALRNGMPVTASWELFESFKQTGRNGRVSVPRPGERRVGAHQMTIVGWTADNHWIVINSWGVRFAHQGMYYIPFEYAPYEMWGVTDKIFPAKLKARVTEMIIGSPWLNVDGQMRPLDVPAQIIGGRTYLPVRAVTEALGASVEWNPHTRGITVRSEERLIRLTIDSTTVEIDGQRRAIDAPPVLIDGRALLPVRFIAEQLNSAVEWNPVAQRVTIRAK
ncbi:MAG: stalk domain-containing protein [Oscillospiraceae bacterium]|nr:stalk domain-containing protein [Oscillospiraceae bacterium]